MVMTRWTMDTDRISKQEQKQFGTWWGHSDGEYSLGNDYDDKEPQLMIKLLAAKQRRKEMWSAIDVNDNGYASLSEITRVSGSFLWCENYVFLWCSNQMTKGSNVWYGKLVCSHDDDQGVRDVIDSDDLFDSRPAINRAFHHCRKLAKVQNNCHCVIIVVAFSTPFLKYAEWSWAWGRLSGVQRVSNFPPNPSTVLWIPSGVQKVWKL